MKRLYIEKSLLRRVRNSSLLSTCNFTNVLVKRILRARTTKLAYRCPRPNHRKGKGTQGRRVSVTKILKKTLADRRVSPDFTCIVHHFRFFFCFSLLFFLLISYARARIEISDLLVFSLCVSLFINRSFWLCTYNDHRTCACTCVPWWISVCEIVGFFSPFLIDFPSSSTLSLQKKKETKTTQRHFYYSHSILTLICRAKN